MLRCRNVVRYFSMIGVQHSNHFNVGDSEPNGFGKYMRVALLCIAAFGAAYIPKLAHFSIPPKLFLPLHLALEYASIVVNFAVFMTGWFGYKQTRNMRDLVIGLTFLVAGILDFVHTLTYKGMPDFLGVNTVGKAAAYWIAARLIVGIGLLIASHVKPQSGSVSAIPRAFVAGALLLAAAIVTVFTLLGNQIGEALYNTGAGLTVLKNILELVSIGIYIAAFASISEKHGWPARTVALLRSALIIAAFGELAFTLYLGPYDTVNAMGHVLKIVSYYLILHALFVSAVQRPYDELAHAKSEIESMYNDAREHRREIERSFARIGSALSASLKPDEALDRIADLASDMLHADCSIVVSFENGMHDIRIAAQRGGCHEAERPLDVALDIGKDAIEQGTSIIINDLQAADLFHCNFDRHDCLRSMVCSPMTLEGKPLGVISIYSHKWNAFEEGDAKLLEGFASHAAVAMHNAYSFEQESRIADVLQRTLLAPGRYSSDNYEISPVYQPAMSEARVGGDFYDIIPISDDKVALLIGDVSGKGLAAAVHTAMVKYSLRAFLHEGHSPAEALKLLNRSVAELADTFTFVTIFLGILNTGNREMVYASAGHEPGLYWYNGSSIRLMPTGAALGIIPDSEYDEEKIVLERNSMLLLYTDGVSEARVGNKFLGTDGIEERLGICDPMDASNVAGCIHRAAIEFAGGELKDDVAILAVRAVGE